MTSERKHNRSWELFTIRKFQTGIDMDLLARCCACFLQQRVEHVRVRKGLRKRQIVRLAAYKRPLFRLLFSFWQFCAAARMYSWFGIVSILFLVWPQLGNDRLRQYTFFPARFQRFCEKIKKKRPLIRFRNPLGVRLAEYNYWLKGDQAIACAESPTPSTWSLTTLSESCSALTNTERVICCTGDPPMRTCAAATASGGCCTPFDNTWRRRTTTTLTACRKHSAITTR